MPLFLFKNLDSYIVSISLIGIFIEIAIAIAIEVFKKSLVFHWVLETITTHTTTTTQLKPIV